MDKVKATFETQLAPQDFAQQLSIVPFKNVGETLRLQLQLQLRSRSEVGRQDFLSRHV